MSSDMPSRDASGCFLKPKGPSQGQTDVVSPVVVGGRRASFADVASASSRRTRSNASASDASRAPSVASVCGTDDDLSDLTDPGTDASLMSESRKRPKDDGSSDSGEKPKKKVYTKKKVLTDTHDVGLADAQRQLNLAKREQLQRDMEEKVAAKEQQACSARAKAGYGASCVNYADYSVAELERMAVEDKGEILEIASKSSNLKWTFQKSLKNRAASICGIVTELAQRKATEETRQLQAKVDRLQSEVSQLHKKLAEVTARPNQADPRPAAEGPSSNLEDTIRKVILEERAFTRACIAGIEDRLLPVKRLRPPLAVDKRPPEPEPSPPQTEDALLPSTTPSNAWTQVAGKGKKGKKAKKAQTMAVTAAAIATPPDPSQTTGKEKKKKGAKSAPKPATTAPAAKRTPAGGRKKLVPPKTAAIVMTLTDEAAAKGETYMSVLVRARASVNPAQLGIAQVSCRRTKAGARIFEFPGAQGSANADLFAAKLKEAIADVAKVVRPVKTVTLEVTDIDDSVTKEEVVAAVVAVGHCDAAAVQARAIRPGRGGMGALRLECPVAAAKAVLAKGRLTIGFSSCATKALPKQPLRCYKCFGIGHTRALCPSKVDRTDSCYRCGKEGHQSASCKAATPHCLVCAASGRPAGHVMKGGNCHPPLKKGKAQAPRTQPATATVAATAATAAEEGGAMSD